MNTGPRGVGGWLAFLVLSLTLFAPLRRLGDTATEFKKAEKSDASLLTDLRWSRYRHKSCAIGSASAALSMTAGVRLWLIHRRNSVHFAILASWAMMPVASHLDAVSIWAIYGPKDAAASLPRMLQSSLISTLSAGLWTEYLMLSKRVRNTYSW